jgi:hypothetical protein
MMSAAKSRSFWVPFVILETLFPLLALVAISIMQSPTRHAATFHCVVTLLGIGFTYFGREFVFERSRVAVRRLLTASIIYLPLLYGLKRDVMQSSQMIHTPTFGRFRKVGHISQHIRDGEALRSVSEPGLDHRVAGSALWSFHVAAICEYEHPCIR